MTNRYPTLFLLAAVALPAFAQTPTVVRSEATSTGGGCPIPAMYGSSVQDVGMQVVAVNNALTGLTCGGKCNNPISFAGVSGTTFYVKSNCTGLIFPHATSVVPDPKGPSNDCQTNTPNPINSANGTKYASEADFIDPHGAISLVRKFHSTAGSPGGAHLGKSWYHSFDIYVTLVPLADSTGADASRATAYMSDGSAFVFRRSAGRWLAEADVSDQLLDVVDSGGKRIGWTYIRSKGNLIYGFDASGWLTKITSASGMYSVANYFSDSANRKVQTVQDPFGRTLAFTYDVSNRLVSIKDPSGALLQYGYDGDNLSTVTYQDKTSRKYLYENTSFPSALTGIQDENKDRYATYSYDTQGRATGSYHGEGVNQYQLAFNSDGTTSITDPLGSVRVHRFTAVLNVPKPSGQSQPSGSGCPAASSRTTYDANANVESRDDFNGNRTCYANDPIRNVETVRVEGLVSSAACNTLLAPGATLPKGSRKMSTQWHPDWALQVRTAEPRKLITQVFNGQPDPFNANAIASCAPSTALLPTGKPIAVLCKRVEQATTDVDGSLGFGAALASGVSPRTWAYTYNQYGQMLTATDPLNRSTTYAYFEDTNTTHTLGDLQTITNAAGQITRFTRYDAVGRPQQVVSPNSLLTDIAYEPRGQISTVTVTPPGGAARITSYAYDYAGQLQQVTEPDGSKLKYTYDTAHRLIGIADQSGNTITYTLDGAGNRTGEQVKDATGKLARRVARTVDALDRVRQVTGAGR